MVNYISNWREKSNKISEVIANNQTQRMIKVTELNGINAQINQLKSEIYHFESLEFGERCDKCASIISQGNTQVFINEKLFYI